MSIFWYEYLHFIAASLAIVVSIASAVLFIITFRYEKTIKTVWRAVGFLLLAIAFLFFILERKAPNLELMAISINLLAFFSLYKGIRAEPSIEHLKKVRAPRKNKTLNLKFKKGKSRTKRTVIILGGVLLLSSIFIVPVFIYVRSLMPSIIQLITIAFIIGIIRIRLRIYREEKRDIKEGETNKNLYSLLGFSALLIKEIAGALFRLPESNIVLLRKLTLEYSLTWTISVMATIVAFMLLAIWAWDFIKVRIFLRTYVILITVVLLVTTFGFLVFTLFVFKIVENNNLDLMLKGAETEAVIIEDRANTALFISKIIATDEFLLKNIETGNYAGIINDAEGYLQDTGVDILRIYNIFGEVTASPSDTRDRGRVVNDDPFLTYSLTKRKVIKSFDSEPGVLSNYIVTRGIHPIILNNTVVGAIEAGYKFDNAFVDFSKEKTNLDVTIYTNAKISATTIKTLDGVSRFIGSDETGKDITKNVLTEGRNYTTSINRFGELYYSAFTPIRDINGKIIGMVSVGTPTFELIEETRQQLISTFIFVSVLAALVALFGYYAIPNLRQENGSK
jgi:hypothetical protein